MSGSGGAVAAAAVTNALKTVVVAAAAAAKIETILAVECSFLFFSNVILYKVLTKFLPPRNHNMPSTYVRYLAQPTQTEERNLAMFDGDGASF